MSKNLHGIPNEQLIPLPVEETRIVLYREPKYGMSRIIASPLPAGWQAWRDADIEAAQEELKHRRGGRHGLHGERESEP